MPSGLRWTVTPQRAWSDLAANYRRRVERGIHAIALRWAPEISNWMKANAVWTDRTGNARQALYTEVNYVAGQMTEIILEHGVEYGIWLEIANAGRFAIISPALDYFGPRIWQDVRRMLS
jgi:hypothetical protein